MHTTAVEWAEKELNQIAWPILIFDEEILSLEISCPQGPCSWYY